MLIEIRESCKCETAFSSSILRGMRFLTFPRSSTSFSFTAHQHTKNNGMKRDLSSRKHASRERKAVNAVPFLPGVSSSRYIYGEAIIINRVASVLLGFTTETRHTFARKLKERTDERARGARTRPTCLPPIVAGALSSWERTIIANSTADVDGYVRANRRIAVACPALIKSHLNYKFLDKSCPTLDRLATA